MSEHSNRSKLMWASFLTLIAAGVGFSVRAGILGDWANQFGFTKSELGTITGGGLVGFGVVIMLASLITDKVGYKALMLLAFVLHLLSAVITLAATPVFAAAGKDATYWVLYVGMFMFAIANGLCECVINPLIATLYPKQKTHYLNILHAGWPAGLIIGGLLGYFLVGKVRWEVPIAIFLVPTLWYGLIVLKERFPVSEVAKAGLSFGTMMKEFAQPMLLFLLFLHACVGYVELGTDSWITNITNSILTGQGFLLFIYASSIMFALRFFAGPIVERINPLGLLAISALLGCMGLLMISHGETAGFIWLAVTVYGVGKTFLWPTMLGVVGERFPRGGAITMGAIGGVGMLSAGLLGGPGIGYKQDYFASHQLQAAAPQTYERYAAANENRFLIFPPVRGLDGQKVGVLTEHAPDGSWTPGAELERATGIKQADGTYQQDQNLQAINAWWAQAAPEREADLKPVGEAVIFGGRMALRWTAAVPATMFVGYLMLVLYFKARGGYKAIHLDAAGNEYEGEQEVTADQTLADGAKAPGSGEA